MTGRFVALRLLQLIPTTAGIVLAGFLLVHAAPGDPVLALAGEHGDAEYYAFIRERFGLDQPLPRQLATYAVRVAQGDFSYSYTHGRNVMSLIVDRAPATLLLTGSALLLAIAVAIPLSAIAAHRAHGPRDVWITVAAIALASAPVFWVGQLAVLAFAVGLQWFPVQGMTSAAAGAVSAADVLWHLALPAMVLATPEVAVLFRVTRSGLVAELARDHVRTARAKGVHEREVVFRHAMPRALVPTISLVGVRAGQLVAGAIVVETVFGWPGIGRLLHSALHARDLPVLLGLFFVISFSVVLFNLAADLLHAALDPRVSLR